MSDVVRDEFTSIHKYALTIDDEVIIKMPRGAEILCVQVQFGLPYIWAKVDSLQHESLYRDRVFYVIGTGHSFPINVVKYVGTFQVEDGRGVFHVYEGKTK